MTKGTWTMVTEDKLDVMWKQQEAFMKLLSEKRNFPKFPVDLHSKEGQKFIADISHHCTDELLEARQHLKNSKSHRTTEVPEIDREAYLEELVDALHLFFEVVIASGFTIEELCAKYLQKGNLNTKRIESGY